MELILDDYIKDGKGNCIEIKKELKHKKYNVKITKKFIYNPEKVQRGYDILYNTIFKQYFNETT